ncbi:MAG: MFS transporter [Eubacteriales bacterium]|nr:MFS transporter [Eubacteriales bacterium]
MRKENTAKKKVKNPQEHLSFGQLLLWNTSAVSRSIALLFTGYLMYYCTDTLGVPAAGVSIILVASKILDGVTDMVAGFIVDRTQTRWGKGRPYEVFIVGLWLCTWLMFSCPPQFSMILKYVWIFVMYALVNSICFTFLNANQAPYIVRAYSSQQIVKQTSYGSIVTMLAAVAFNITFPILMGRLATSAAGWSALAAIFAVPLAAIGILRMIFVKEKNDVDVTANQEEKLKVADVITVMRQNKYILLLASTSLIFNFVTNMGIGTYYYKYIVGDVSLMSVAAAAQAIAIPLALVFPQLISRFSVVKLMIAGYFISAVGYLIFFFAGSSVPLLVVGAILSGMGTIPASMLIGLVILDCADYNEWKGIHRMEGTMSSINGLGGKIGAAIGAGMLGILLQISGYTGVAETMPDSAYLMIKLLMSLIPMALYILTGLSLFTYKLDKKLPQIKAENAARRAAAEAELKK